MATDRPVGKVAYLGNTNTLRLDGLRLLGEDTYADDATVTATVKDADGNAVTGQSWPVALAYVAGSDGRYEGALSHQLALEDGAEYVAEIAAEAASGAIGFWEFPFVASVRRAI